MARAGEQSEPGARGDRRYEPSCFLIFVLLDRCSSMRRRCAEGRCLRGRSMLAGSCLILQVSSGGGFPAEPPGV